MLGRITQRVSRGGEGGKKKEGQNRVRNIEKGGVERRSRVRGKTREHATAAKEKR